MLGFGKLLLTVLMPNNVLGPSQSPAICNDYSVNDVSSHRSLEAVFHAFVKDSQLEGVGRAADTTSAMVECVGIDHCRLHVFVCPNPRSIFHFKTSCNSA
jgi:hypothetical protein